MSTPLTTTWLRENGFNWHQLERQPSRHWVLWIGQRLPSHEMGAVGDHDAFGVEVAIGRPGADWWFVWFRADYCGRYSRFLCAGHITTTEQLVGMIEGIIGGKFDASHVIGGRLHTPKSAERYHAEGIRFDLELARSKDRMIVRAEAQQIEQQFRGRDWYDHVEVEDDRSCVVYVRRWPDYKEREGMPATAGIEMVATASV